LYCVIQRAFFSYDSSNGCFGYDAAGNFNFKSDFSQASGTPYKLATGGLGGGGANAVKQVTLIGGVIRNYGYDASGNMTADDNTANQFAAKYDHANLATKLQRGAVINYFTYGPNNAKARQTGTDGSKVYLGGYEDWITAGQTKVSLGNYAQITNGTGGRVLHYFLTDRLGSVDAVTDGNGNLIETRGYDAFGAPRTGVWGDATQIASTAITPKGFTSHEHLNSVKLIHMNGRMYDFQLGRFLGVDPFIQAPTNSQSMNPYSYIMNNPLSGTDPTGYTACTDVSTTEAGSGSCDHTLSTGDKVSVDYNVSKKGTVSVTTSSQNFSAIAKDNKATQTNGSGGQSPSTGSNDPKSLDPSSRKPTGTIGTSQSDSDAISAAGKMKNTSPNEPIYQEVPNGQPGDAKPSNDSATVDPKATLLVHGHVLMRDESGKIDETEDALLNAFRRILPTSKRADGQHDANVVIVYKLVNYTRGTDGVVRSVESTGIPFGPDSGTADIFRVRTVTPGVPDAHDQENWRPGRRTEISPTQENAIQAFRKGRMSFQEALEKGGVRVEK